jgi:hypothetical protein
LETNILINRSQLWQNKIIIRIKNAEFGCKRNIHEEPQQRRGEISFLFILLNHENFVKPWKLCTVSFFLNIRNFQQVTIFLFRNNKFTLSHKIIFSRKKLLFRDNPTRVSCMWDKRIRSCVTIHTYSYLSPHISGQMSSMMGGPPKYCH